MLRRALTPLAVGTLVSLAGCLSENVMRSSEGPMYAVSDGAHHGNPDFFFLPPMFGNPSKDPNFEPTAFNGSLRPAVEICELGDLVDEVRECVDGDPFRRFAPGTVNVSLTDQQYQVNWDTKSPALNVTKYYRVQVFVGAVRLGFADIEPVSNGSQLKNVQTGEFVGLVDGRTLPIKFRIENGALCSADATGCAAETITLSEGGGVELIVPGEDFHFDIPAGTQGRAGGQTVTEVTFNIETCEGIDVDLPKFGQCLRVTALYDASGTVLTLNQAALISMCSFVAVSEGQQALITLHQQDGDLIRALPHAHPNCDVIGARSAAPAGLAARGWRWLRHAVARAVTPRRAYAVTRTTMLHLGGGGETTKFGATCTSTSSSVAKMALAECMPASAALTPLPMPGHTISDFQFALPAKMDYVRDPDTGVAPDSSRIAPPGALPTRVKVTDWNGAAVQGARVTFVEPPLEGSGEDTIGAAISDAGGIAQILWTISEGPNRVVASGRGIAAANNFPAGVPVKPFMPDIFNPDTAQTLGTGEITFLATGAAGLLLRYSFEGNADNTGALPGYNGTATSVTYPAGKFGLGIKFDGTAATGATFPGTATAFALGDKWTISLWFREDVKTPETLLWRFRGSTQGWETYHGVVEPDQRMVTCSDGGCLSFISGAGVWHSLVYRYDGVSATVGAPVQIYVDGALAGQIDNAGAIPLVGSGVTDIRMGNLGDILGPSVFYIDEFRVYNQVFTVALQCTIVVGGTWNGTTCTLP